MIYKYSLKSFNKLYLKKSIMLYFFSLFNFFFNCYSLFFLFKFFFFKEKKISYLNILFSFLFQKEKWIYLLFFFFKKAIILKEKKIINKDRITFTIFSIKKKATLLSVLRSFFIYKKSFEQFGKQTKHFNFFFNSNYFFPFFDYKPMLETVVISKKKIDSKALNIYIK